MGCRMCDDSGQRLMGKHIYVCPECGRKLYEGMNDDDEEVEWWETLTIKLSKNKYWLQ